MKQKPSAFRRIIALGAAALAASIPVHAQSPATGRIVGRIFNPATKEYVRNAEIAVQGTNLVAYSGPDGSYQLSNVPAGEVTVSVTYTGYDRAADKVVLTAGQTATRDFDLKGSVLTAQKGATATAGEVISLEALVVSGERAGNAKALMQARAAMNIKNVIASDTFGNVTGGNIGEFVKYMPGVVIDYADDDARTARINGLDASYSSVSIDGMQMATAASASFGSRAFDFEQASIVGIESIEINKTLTAKMDANAPAGTITLVSKNAFERKGRDVMIQQSISANEYAFTLKRTPSPGDGYSRKIRPGFIFSYGENFAGRLGIRVDLSANSVYSEQAGVTNTYNTANLATRGPVINTISFRDSPKITHRSVAGLNADYKIADGLVFSLRSQSSHFEEDINARLSQFIVNSAQVTTTSTVTNVTALPSTNSATKLRLSTGESDKFNDTVSYVPKLELRRNDLVVTATGGYSRSRTHYEDRRSGLWGTMLNDDTRIGWNATRSASDSTDWQLTQTSGLPIGNIASYNRTDAVANNVQTGEHATQMQVFQGQLDATQTFHVGGLPITVSAGAKTSLTTMDLERNGALSWTYVGPSGSQLNPSTVMIAHTEPGLFDPMKGDNLASLNIPVPNATAMYSLYQQHPEYFSENTFANFTALMTGQRAVKEQMDAGYVEFNSRWNKLRLNLGVRHERTRDVARNFDILPAAQVTAAGYTAGTIPFLTYQYRNFEKRNHYGSYGNTFFSGGAKYMVMKNLEFQLAGSQSIRRPTLNNLAGVISINDTTRIITLPNPELKPATSNKYYADITYYLEPAGKLKVSGFLLDVRNQGQSNTQVSAEEAGYAGDPAYLDYTFVHPTSLAGITRIKGAEIEYQQNLVFLPGFARGFSVFGSLSRTSSSVRLGGMVPKSASGGLGYNNRKFHAELRSTWRSSIFSSATATSTNYVYERTMFDFSGRVSTEQDLSDHARWP